MNSAGSMKLVLAQLPEHSVAPLQADTLFNLPRNATGQIPFKTVLFSPYEEKTAYVPSIQKEIRAASERGPKQPFSPNSSGSRIA